jgi:hypothetical protein
MNATQALARLHHATARHRQSMQKVETALLRKAVVATTAAGFGMMRRHSVSMSIKGFPWKLAVWLGATVTEAMTKGGVQTVAGALGDTTLASYTEGAVAGGSLIAGDEDSAAV